MSAVVTIGQVPWSRADMIAKLEEFASLYARRPITDNEGGMRSPHLFLAWFALQALRPKAVIESGVLRGQGTWFFERACPDAQLYCIEPNLDRIQYRSDRAKYLDRDFSTIDWSGLPRDETVLFFDDHQNAHERAQTASWFGFKQLIFEDNYPSLQGDCYSLKKVFMQSGFQFSPPPYWSLKSRLKWHLARVFGALAGPYRSIPANELDAKYLRQNLEVYCELPPVFKPDRTFWGDPWDDQSYPTAEPLLRSLAADYQRV